MRYRRPFQRSRTRRAFTATKEPETLRIVDPLYGTSCNVRFYLVMT